LRIINSRETENTLLRIARDFSDGCRRPRPLHLRLSVARMRVITCHRSTNRHIQACGHGFTSLPLDLFPFMRMATARPSHTTQVPTKKPRFCANMPSAERIIVSFLNPLHRRENMMLPNQEHWLHGCWLRRDRASYRSLFLLNVQNVCSVCVGSPQVTNFLQ
jgi:hypothetical protein